MRTFVLVGFYTNLISGALCLIGLAALDEKRWTNLFNTISCFGLALWAAILLWR